LTHGIGNRVYFALARAAPCVVTRGRKAIGCGPIAACRLGREWWNLDLREGIDFSIFLLGGLEREMNPAARPAGFSERPHRLIYRAQEAEFF